MKIAIIGAGLSGMTAARHLSEHAEVHIFEKSRGVGGRMSTRYAGAGVGVGAYEFDHGAQYFTAKDPRFQSVVTQAVEAGHVAPWSGRAFYLKTGLLTGDMGAKRYVATPRMNSWVKHLAQGLTVQTGQKVVQCIRMMDKRWLLQCEEGQTQDGFDHVIFAIPSHQAQALLPDNFAHMDAIKATTMDACFALMIGFDEPVDFGWDTLRVNDLPVSWMAVNSAKPGRIDSPATLVVHADPQWSNDHAESDRGAVQSVMEDITSALTKTPISHAPHRVLHRWLYASVSQYPNQACLHDPDLRLSACGDWCLGGRVEGAYLSGLTTAQAVMSAGV